MYFAITPQSSEILPSSMKGSEPQVYDHFFAKKHMDMRKTSNQMPQLPNNLTCNLALAPCAPSRVGGLFPGDSKR